MEVSDKGDAKNLRRQWPSSPRYSNACARSLTVFLCHGISGGLNVTHN